MPIDRTFVPALPSQSRLTVREVTSERFVVSYSDERKLMVGCLTAFSMFIFIPFAAIAAIYVQKLSLVPWWMTLMVLVGGMQRLIQHSVSGRPSRREGGRLQLKRHQLRVEGGVFFRSTKTYPIEVRSRLEVIRIGIDSDIPALSLRVNQEWHTLAQECQINVADQKWLCQQMNAWLGWEFPSHCVACGRPLESHDVDWQQRSVRCSGCGFPGPAPDPFAINAASPAPPFECPCCHGAIWLNDVNRETGGCRCHRCQWSSEALPPMRLDSLTDAKSFLITVMGGVIPVVLSLFDKLVSDDKLQREYPSAASARRQLENDHLIEEGSRDKLTLTFGHWQVLNFSFWVLATGSLLILNFGLLFWVFPGTPPRTWLHWFGRLSSFLMLPLSGGAAAFTVWWAMKRVCMIFTTEALLLQIGQTKRVIRWNTLKQAATHDGVWPPMVYLVYGGTGAIVTPPSHTAARAITRLCQIHRQDETRYAPAAAQDPIDRDRIAGFRINPDLSNSPHPGSALDEAPDSPPH